MKPKKKSWLTTLFGWIAAIGGVVATVSPDPTTKLISGTIAATATGLLGHAARDNKVSSEDVGAK